MVTRSSPALAAVGLLLATLTACSSGQAGDDPIAAVQGSSTTAPAPTDPLEQALDAALASYGLGSEDVECSPPAAQPLDGEDLACVVSGGGEGAVVLARVDGDNVSLSPRGLLTVDEIPARLAEDFGLDASAVEVSCDRQGVVALADGESFACQVEAEGTVNEVYVRGMHQRRAGGWVFVSPEQDAAMSEAAVLRDQASSAVEERHQGPVGDAATHRDDLLALAQAHADRRLEDFGLPLAFSAAYPAVAVLMGGEPSPDQVALGFSLVDPLADWSDVNPARVLVVVADSVGRCAVGLVELRPAPGDALAVSTEALPAGTGQCTLAAAIDIAGTR